MAIPSPHSIGTNFVPYFTYDYTGQSLPKGYEHYLPHAYAGKVAPAQPVTALPIGRQFVYTPKYDQKAYYGNPELRPLNFLGKPRDITYADPEQVAIEQAYLDSLKDPNDTWQSTADDEIWNNGNIGTTNKPYYDPFAEINKARLQNAQRQNVDNSWKNTDKVIEENIHIDPLGGVPKHDITPQIPDKPGQNLTNYMSNDAFKQYYELNRNAFDRADPNISMQEHYANWLRNKDYLPEAYKEQPGFFGQLGQGLMDNFTKNPLGFAGGLFNLYQGFKQAGYMKDYYNTQKDLYNTQKNIMLNNERRNQEQWNMLKRQRASSSL